MPRPKLRAPSDYAFLNTRMGKCAIAWGENGVQSVLLPGESERQMRGRLRKRLGEINETAPPQTVRKTMRNIRQCLEGRPHGLTEVIVDLYAVTPFTRRVYQLLRRTQMGETLSYGELAARAGSPGAARAVGRAMANNPCPLIIPCHRVVTASGQPGEFSAPGGTQTKTALLATEQQLAVRATRSRPSKARQDLFHGGRTLNFSASLATQALCQADRRLGRFIGQLGPLQLKRVQTGSSFAALAEAIVYQQLAGSAAKAIFSRIKTQLAAKRSLKPEHIVRTDTTKLRALGLSRNKAAALEDLARRALEGQLPSIRKMKHMDDETIVQALTTIRGIGRWTAEMLLIFRLGRPDVLPATDYGIRKGFALIYEQATLPSPRELLAHGERWRPYRSAASWYLWRALDLAS